MTDNVTDNVTDDETDDRSAAEDDAGFDEARRHLDPVVDHLSEKFPDAGRDHVAETVDSAFADLSSNATIPDHLAALTQHHAQEALLAENAEPNEASPEDLDDR